jgi:V/A-type H+-transporting ATPase subunit I
VAINLLGAFVHPLRLEFVEFFGKFYDDGGAEFKPFGVESKIVIIKEPEGTS